jgi:hypothetical protein
MDLVGQDFLLLVNGPFDFPFARITWSCHGFDLVRVFVILADGWVLQARVLTLLTRRFM